MTGFLQRLAEYDKAILVWGFLEKNQKSFGPILALGGCAWFCFYELLVFSLWQHFLLIKVVNDVISLENIGYNLRVVCDSIALLLVHGDAASTVLSGKSTVHPIVEMKGELWQASIYTGSHYQ